MTVNLPISRFFKKCDECAVNNRALCKNSSGKAADALARISHSKTVHSGKVIAAEHESMDYVGNVVSGVIKMTKTLEDGRQQIVGLLFPSDFFGQLFADETRFSFEAASDVELCVFDRASFEALLVTHPEIEHELLKRVLTELDAAREWMVLLGCQSAKERIAGFLLMLLRRAKMAGCTKDMHSGNMVIRFPISRRDIALFLGTTLETISRQLQKLAKAGVISIVDGSTFEILKPHQLAQEANHAEWLEGFPV